MLKREIFVCDCHSLEHQYAFWYDEELNELYFEPHLFNNGRWYRRFLNRLNYLIGYKTRFGAWDEVTINKSDVDKLINILNKIKGSDIELVADRGRD